jgi:S-adenosylmethionine/arginine decarboxylase-like enzyme
MFPTRDLAAMPRDLAPAFDPQPTPWEKLCGVGNATALVADVSEVFHQDRDDLGLKPLICREQRAMWGKHVIIDMSAGDRERVQSAQHISRFVETLVETIDMKAYGPPVLEHFAEHVPEAAGYSLVQLIETSAITGHFCDRSGDAYIDIFSCKDFQAELAVEVVRAAFRPRHINFMTLARQAVQPCASYMRAAECVFGAD